MCSKVYSTGLEIQGDVTKLLSEEVWSGYVGLGGYDFPDEAGGTVNVPMASVGAAIVGLRAVLDLRFFVPTASVTEIVILSDHTVTESALSGLGNTKFPYLAPLVGVLQEYKKDIVNNEYPSVNEIKLTKIDAVNNRAAKLAKQLKNPNNVDALTAANSVSTIGDYELYPAFINSYRLARPGGKTASPGEQ